MTKTYILTADDVVDNLTSDLEDVPLSANMGRELKALIDAGGGGGAHTISASAGEGGSITPVGEIGVLKGDSKTFTIGAEESHNISDVKVDGVSQGAISTYTFSNVQADHTIEAVFSKKQYTVTMQAGSHGTISGDATVEWGTNHTYTITADAGCRIVDVKVDGTSRGAVSSVELVNVKKDYTITASFIQQFTVTASAGANGGISPAGTQTYDAGATPTYTFTANSGYVIDKVLVDGSAVTVTGTTYTFQALSANHTISVSFMENPQNFYTFKINKTTMQTNPTGCVSYTEGVSSAAEAYNVAYNWVVPTVVKNGTVAYELSKSNLQNKASGGTAKLDGTDGDVCCSIKPIWWKVNDDGSNYVVRISDGPFDGAITPHKFSGTVRKYLHLGMFDMSNSSANSIYNTTLSGNASPWANMTHDSARSAAENRGATYGMMTFLSWSAYQILCIFASGSLNTQTTIGKDLTSGSRSAVATSAMLTANGYTSSTKSDASKQLMYLFLACPWGNVRQWVAGLKTVSSTTGFIKDQADARGVTVAAAIPSTWEKVSTPTSCSGYMTAALMNQYAPFAGSASSGGSSSTYFCDSFYWYSGTYIGLVGGGYSDGDYAGAFFAGVDGGASYALGSIGARLQILDTQTAA